MKKHSAVVFAALAMAGTACAHAQTAPRIDKVDPPNWWAGMPKPMLLVRGEGFQGASFRLSDAHLKVERATVSENGHWAQVWLSASPAKAETVQLRVARGGDHAEAPYTFAERKPASAGFAGFNASDVMYLIMQDRFADGDLNNDGLHGDQPERSEDAHAERGKIRGWHGGDLRGIEQHLDYLQQLGVTALWNTPVYQNHEPDSYHGYGATDMYAVDEHYGTLADLQSLAAALHKRGMKLVLDTVPNHVGPAHPWTTDEPMPDWFHGTVAHHPDGETNFRALMDPHAPESARVGTLHGWFAGILPDMNTENPVVAQYLRQNAIWWIEQTGADALRIDTFPYVDRPFWHEFNAELHQLYPRLTEVGEAHDGDPVFVSSQAAGVTRTGVDTGLYTPFDFPTFFTIRDVFTKNAPMTKLADTLSDDNLYPHPERLTVFLGSHDETRIGEETSPALARMAMAYVLTTRGMPQLYAGDEIGMHGGGDPDNRRDFPGGWPGDAHDAFTEAGRTPEEQRMFSWVSGLTQLRKHHVALQCGEEQVLNAGADWLVTIRDGTHIADPLCGKPAQDRVLVAMHRGDYTWSKSIELKGTGLEGCVLRKPEVAGEGSSAEIQDGRLTLTVKGDDVLIAACQ